MAADALLIGPGIDGGKDLVRFVNKLIPSLKPDAVLVFERWLYFFCTSINPSPTVSKEKKTRESLLTFSFKRRMALVVSS